MAQAPRAGRLEQGKLFEAPDGFRWPSEASGGHFLLISIDLKPSEAPDGFRWPSEASSDSFRSNDEKAMLQADADQAAQALDREMAAIGELAHLLVREATFDCVDKGL